MAGMSGWMVKMWGILILALTWILIFMMSISAGNGSSNGTGDPIGSIYDVLTAFALMHALGFSLIALGWVMENSESEKFEAENSFEEDLVVNLPPPL